MDTLDKEPKVLRPRTLATNLPPTDIGMTAPRSGPNKGTPYPTPPPHFKHDDMMRPRTRKGI
eukprot:8078115-Pyramimonas_sp.AAC.1